jgi:PAS domain S-box-containing protein
LPTSQASINPLSKLFRLLPHRDLFRALADSLDQAVLVLSADAASIETFNHSFLLLSGYARTELEALEPADLFPDHERVDLLQRLAEAEGGPELALPGVPMRTREGELIPLDLQVLTVGTPKAALLIKAEPSDLREEGGLQARQGVAPLRELADLLLGSGSADPSRSMALISDALQASAVGLYRVSPHEPDYVLEGSLPQGFPARLAAAELDPLARPMSWAKGDPAEHPLHRAARSLGLRALRTAPVGAATAWIGLLVAGWRASEEIPEEVEARIGIAASLIHAGLLLQLQRTTQEELHTRINALELEFETQMGAVGDGVISLDPSLAVQRANAAAGRMLGYRPEELQGLAVQEVLVGPADIMTTLLDAVGHQRPAERARLTLHRRDGTPFPVHLRAVPMARAASSRLLIVLSDQSERKAIEDQTETLTQRALLGEVAAIFAHEVRNPINNISTGLQLVASRLGPEHAQHASLERIRNECTRLDQLMEDVLFFARPLELKIVPLNLGEFLDRILGRWEPRLHQAQIKLHRTFDPATPAVSADARTLEQVVVNLITNAIQAMPAGGTLSVSLAPGEARHGREVQVTIADTGSGIREDLLERIFDPFFTTKKAGTGLGLAISRRIMVAHQGGIRVRSYPDAGTVFTLHLPIAETPGETP